jgi:hypothetical protein
MATPQRATTRNLELWRRVLVGFCATLAGGCGLASTTDSTTTARSAAVYVAVLASLDPGPAIDEDVPTVFVSSLDPTRPIPLEVQTAVVNDTSEWLDVRFVDDLSEATIDDGPSSAFHGGAVLFALGEVPPPGEPIEVTAHRYRSSLVYSRYVVRPRGLDGAWEPDPRPELLSVEVVTTTP